MASNHLSPNSQVVLEVYQKARVHCLPIFLLRMMVVLKQAGEDMVKKLSIPPIGDDFIMKATLMMFVVGIMNVWLYAAIRPRFGAGPRTAAIAGFAVWFFCFVYLAMMMTWMGVFEIGPTIAGLGFELVEAILASLAGAWIYKE